MANSNTSYNNDKPTPAIEFDQNNESPSGTFLHSDFKKHKDLKVMLDSNKDGLKLEAMKRIISMVANGRDASDLFPAVVKNVVSKNIEIKKLVYVYLVRYAEEQQDLALLSISTFQRALKDPNQLIRGSALRVLSSIRVPVIVPIMMLAIRDGVNDMSPYVRKTAAHAIPKLYSLDPEHRDELVSVVEKLLSDKSTLVMGSAVMAFEEVCPEKIELIHKNFRKLCNLLVDVEEWGQVIIINMLTRYARTQFVDPNAEEEGEEEEQTFYEEDEERVSDVPVKKPSKIPMDPDHRLLLRNTKPLLQSRNTAVVMAVAQLYHHLAPRQEVPIAAKALIRLLRSYREVQCVVLNTIAAMSQHRKGMFEPYLKSFFVRWSDVTVVKLLKLEILTTLASEVNISVILRELQTYIGSSDKEFVAATIQAIGRCASNIKEVTDTCLNGLVALLANRNESVVAESVVVIRKLLQLQPSQHRDIIKQLARLVDSIAVPNARASILWLLGEYCERVPQLAPDVLRKMAKSFTNEEDIVKLQTLSLATKLYLTNGKQTKLLCQYIFNLAKYDQSYDIRDRARFLRHFIFPSPGCESEQLAKYAKKILLASKPAPVLASKFREQEPYQLGSLSHYINSPALGYQDLPEFPKVAPDPSVRNVETPFPWKESNKKKKQVPKSEGYDEWGTSPVPGSDKSGTSGSGEEESSDEETSSSDSEGDSSSSEESSEDEGTPLENHNEKDKISNLVDLSDTGFKTNQSNEAFESDIQEDDEEGTTSGDSSDMESSSASSSVSSSDAEDKPKAKPNHVNKITKPTQKQKPQGKSNIDLLMELDGFCGPEGLMPQPILTPTLGEQLPDESHNDNDVIIVDNSVQTVGVVHTPVFQHLLLKSSFGGGLEVKCCFTRQPSLVSSSMIVMEWEFRNTSDDLIRDICLVRSSQPRNIKLQYFDKIDFLPSKQSTRRNVEITVADSTQAVNLEVAVNERKVTITLELPAGERVKPVKLSTGQFENSQAKLSGMNEQSGVVHCALGTASEVWEVLREHVNMFLDSGLSGDHLRLTGQMVASQSLVLMTVSLSKPKHTVTINCEDIIFGCMLLKQVQSLLEA